MPRRRSKATSSIALGVVLAAAVHVAAQQVSSDGCLYLTGSQACPGFQDQYVSTTGLGDTYNFMYDVTDVASFDTAVLAYFNTSTQWPQTKQNQLGCWDYAGSSWPAVMRYQMTVMCARWTHDSSSKTCIRKYLGSAAVTSQKAICQSTCQEFSQSQIQVVNDTHLCPGKDQTGGSRNRQITQDLQQCMSVASADSTCVTGAVNEPKTCGYGNSTTQMCGFCQVSTDSCCGSVANFQSICGFAVSGSASSSASSASASASAAAAKGGKKSGLSGGAIAGIVVGVIGGLLILGLIIGCCLWRRRKNNRQGGHVLMSPGNEKDDVRTASPVTGSNMAHNRAAPVTTGGGHHGGATAAAVGAGAVAAGAAAHPHHNKDAKLANASAATPGAPISSMYAAGPGHSAPVPPAKDTALAAAPLAAGHGSSHVAPSAPVSGYSAAPHTGASLPTAGAPVSAGGAHAGAPLAGTSSPTHAGSHGSHKGALAAGAAAAGLAGVGAARHANKSHPSSPGHSVASPLGPRPPHSGVMSHNAASPTSFAAPAPGSLAAGPAHAPSAMPAAAGAGAAGMAAGAGAGAAPNSPNSLPRVKDAQGSWILPGAEVLVAHPYTAQLRDELTLRPGMRVRVLALYDDGWATGTVSSVPVSDGSADLQLGRQGQFPTVCVSAARD